VRELSGRTALVTGAAGGLGPVIVRRLAGEGMEVVASDREDADLRDPEAIDALAARAGAVDVLVANAAVEVVAGFTALAREEIRDIVAVNLVAPMLLTQRVLPGMLARGRGHVVFVSSVAGRFGPAYDHPYAATKAGLIALTQSLRAEYADAPVGFSVVCPGFVAGAGGYQRMVDEGVRAGRLMGSTTLERVADRLVEAIRDDLPEVIETGAPVRPALALSLLAPRLAERVATRLGLHAFFRRVAATRGRLP
jgi:NAD(P)-dependent dehydrogenase (short-subunit alcohol dehydrogenase family)